MARLKKFLAVNKQISSAVSNERSNHIQAEGEEKEVKDAKGGTALASSKVTQRMFDSYLKLCPLPKWPNKDLSDEERRRVEDAHWGFIVACSTLQRVNETTGTSTVGKGQAS